MTFAAMQKRTKKKQNPKKRAPALRRQEAVQPPVPSKEHEGKPKLLIVDDDPFIVSLYVVKFESAGFAVEVARNGKEALEMLERFTPDVILLDLLMPVMNGFEFLENVKKIDRFGHIPIVAFTNRFSMSEESRARALGVDEYCIKIHFTPDELVSKIREFLSNRGTAAT
jgi:CheY-like chemotaxis protein